MKVTRKVTKDFLIDNLLIVIPLGTSETLNINLLDDGIAIYIISLILLIIKQGDDLHQIKFNCAGAEILGRN